MPAMILAERLALWKKIAGAVLRERGFADSAEELESRPWKDEYDLFGYFDCFRPDGAGVDRVFEGVVRGDEILERLMRVFHATRESLERRFLYFIVCRPLPATQERLRELAEQRLDKIRRIVRAYAPDRAAFFEAPVAIEIRYEPPPHRGPPDYDEPEVEIYDLAGDWRGSLKAVPSDARLLHGRSTPWHVITRSLIICCGRFTARAPTSTNLSSPPLNCGRMGHRRSIRGRDR